MDAKGVVVAALGNNTDKKYLLPRQRLVEYLRKEVKITDERVLNAIAKVPRHLFVPSVIEGQVYQDTPLPIGEGQTISAPGIVATMSQALELTGKEKVLEVGTGSGYQAAILAQIASEVISIERIPRLAASARKHLDRAGVSNVIVRLGDGSRGRPEDAPFDAILVTAGGPRVPEALLKQLVVGGRLVGPFGEKDAQRLFRYRRREGDQFDEELLAHCRFVSLIGEHAWPE